PPIPPSRAPFGPLIDQCDVFDKKLGFFEGDQSPYVAQICYPFALDDLQALSDLVGDRALPSIQDAFQEIQVVGLGPRADLFAGSGPFRFRSPFQDERFQGTLGRISREIEGVQVVAGILEQELCSTKALSRRPSV